MDQHEVAGLGERATAAPKEVHELARAGEQTPVSTSVSAAVPAPGPATPSGRARGSVGHRAGERCRALPARG